jgi:parallel beta-helix repeat protein
MVVDCSASSNSHNGIILTRDCTVRGNNCFGNGAGIVNGAGIHASGSDNRFEDNNCTDNDYGIHVEGAGNIIIRNTCSGNATDWNIVANNVVGPILDRRAPASGAILGFSAPSSLGSTDPNANFSY